MSRRPTLKTIQIRDHPTMRTILTSILCRKNLRSRGPRQSRYRRRKSLNSRRKPSLNGCRRRSTRSNSRDRPSPKSRRQSSPVSCATLRLTRRRRCRSTSGGIMAFGSDTTRATNASMSAQRGRPSSITSTTPTS